MPRLTQVTSASPHFLCFGEGLLPSALPLSAMLLVPVLACLGGWHPLGGEGAFSVSRECLEERAQLYCVAPCRQLLCELRRPAHRDVRAAGTSRRRARLQVWDVGPVPAQSCCVTWAGRGNGVALSLLCASEGPVRRCVRTCPVQQGPVCRCPHMCSQRRSPTSSPGLLHALKECWGLESWAEVCQRGAV